METRCGVHIMANLLCCGFEGEVECGVVGWLLAPVLAFLGLPASIQSTPQVEGVFVIICTLPRDILIMRMS